MAYPVGITTVILEEIGHYLDAHLGPGDAKGDEGAIFASLVQCRTQDLEAWRKEDDWGTLTIGGATVTVEYSAPDPVVRNILLQEKSNFSSSHTVPVVIPEEPSVLTFNYNLTFDRTDENGINDAFEVVLVGENGDSLVHTIVAGRDAFVNVTEGEGVALARGVSSDSGTVTLDLSGISGETKANLIFRLVNNDGDTETRVTIGSIEVVPGTVSGNSSNGIPINNLVNDEIYFGALEDVSGSLKAVYGRTSWWSESDVLYVDAQIVNEGTYEVRNNLLVAVTGISDPTVRVRDFDGVTPDGLPYYTYSKVMEDGVLAPGEKTGVRTIAFTNPEGVQFDYELVFLGELNRAPEFVGEPDREVVVGQEYIYTTRAVDPDGDELRYSVLVCPSGLTLEQDTGEVRWSTPVVGNYTVTLAVEDGHGGRDIQTYTLQVVENVPNRPPIFTATPVVDGNVNSIYTYSATAVDPDGDELSYRVEAGPEGLTVEGETGLVTWTPTGKQVGVQEVTHVVEDGRGSKTTQIFDVLVLPEKGNNAPIIISEPVRQIILPNQQYNEPEALDLSTWSTINYPLTDSIQRLGNWELQSDDTVLQTKQTVPTIYLSDFQLENARIEGSWRIDTDFDD
ncbi:MAG: Ig-like domain-containing protein, partial [Prochloron sp. SP5CPC1]|nr:Ig-like domain-containing protein [Candidatus Paraprochloron terpiosi SP5CPC1]